MRTNKKISFVCSEQTRRFQLWLKVLYRELFVLLSATDWQKNSFDYEYKKIMISLDPIGPIDVSADVRRDGS